MTSLPRAKEVLQIEAEGIIAVIDQLDADFDKAIELVLACPTRLIICGIGKSGIIGQKIAATLNSTGTPSLFLHPVEAMHGDLGIVEPSDVVLAISYSGETSELNLLMPTLKSRGVKIIALTSNGSSTLAGFADATLRAAVPREACPLGLAPTASTTAALAIGDALAVVLIDRKNFAASDFRKNHPGGSLGERLKVKVSEVMMTGAAMPIVSPQTSFAEAVAILNEKNIGAVLVIENNMLRGIITDGDIRRLISSNKTNLAEITAKQVMTASPKTIDESLLAADALSIMQDHEVTALPVTNAAGDLCGLLHLHDLLGKGEFRLLV
ncbi:MAG: KpsF/GutQ family sugar-phosphate isomerase [Proteobacteria bacterium]|nr:KpsF/GutQ family sugar-phosphate isomerase [Pseudomonadota bacterium]MBU1639687.1 KpsF/GutQ family sugar-phosphate isomerase [Pseudomonadota bacterium]